MDGCNPFEVFNVDVRVTDEQVQTQYRRLVFEHHPDRNPGDPHATARMQAINAAFGQICTAEKRAASVDQWLPFYAKKLLVSMADALESNMTSLQRAQDRAALAYAYGEVRSLSLALHGLATMLDTWANTRLLEAMVRQR